MLMKNLFILFILFICANTSYSASIEKNNEVFEVIPGKKIGNFFIGMLTTKEDEKTFFVTNDGVIETIISKDNRCSHKGNMLIGMSIMDLEKIYGKLKLVKDNTEKINIPMYEIENGLIVGMVDGIVDHVIVFK